MRAFVVVALLCSGPLSGLDLPQVLSRSGPLRTETIPLRSLDREHQYSLLYSISPLRQLGPDAQVSVDIRQADRTLVQKTLHAGDPDFYTQFGADGPAEIRIRADHAAGKYK